MGRPRKSRKNFNGSSIPRGGVEAYAAGRNARAPEDQQVARVWSDESSTTTGAPFVGWVPSDPGAPGRYSIPVGDEVAGETFIRCHELAHIHYTPSGLYDAWPEVEPGLLNAIEDARINAIGGVFIKGMKNAGRKTQVIPTGAPLWASLIESGNLSTAAALVIASIGTGDESPALAALDEATAAVWVRAAGARPTANDVWVAARLTAAFETIKGKLSRHRTTKLPLAGRIERGDAWRALSAYARAVLCYPEPDPGPGRILAKHARTLGDWERVRLVNVAALFFNPPPVEIPTDLSGKTPNPAKETPEEYAAERETALEVEWDYPERPFSTSDAPEAVERRPSMGGGRLSRRPERVRAGQYPFDRARPVESGERTVFVLDASGSMDNDPDELAELMARRPDALVVAYCGDGVGLATILAKDGTRAAGYCPAAGGNACDSEVIEALAPQADRLIWITDLGIGGGSRGRREHASRCSAALAGLDDARIVESVRAYLDQPDAWPEAGADGVLDQTRAVLALDLIR